MKNIRAKQFYLENGALDDLIGKKFKRKKNSILSPSKTIGDIKLPECQRYMKQDNRSTRIMRSKRERGKEDSYVQLTPLKRKGKASHKS